MENKIKKFSSEKITKIMEELTKHSSFWSSQFNGAEFNIFDSLNEELANRCIIAFKKFSEENEYAKKHWINITPPEDIDYSRLEYEYAPMGWGGPIWFIKW